MHIYTLRCELLTQTPIDDVFRIFENPSNLAKITPCWLNFRVTSPEPVHMRQGAEIQYRIRWMGLQMKWKTVIREYRPPLCFVDEQTSGPYSLWRHRHVFEATQEGTKVGDHVEYALPLGLLGRFAHAALVRRQLVEIFQYRQQEITKMLGGSTVQTVAPAVAG